MGSACTQPHRAGGGGSARPAPARFPLPVGVTRAPREHLRRQLLLWTWLQKPQCSSRDTDLLWLGKGQVFCRCCQARSTGRALCAPRPHLQPGWRTHFRCFWLLCTLSVLRFWCLLPRAQSSPGHREKSWPPSAGTWLGTRSTAGLGLGAPLPSGSQHALQPQAGCNQTPVFFTPPCPAEMWSATRPREATLLPALQKLCFACRGIKHKRCADRTPRAQGSEPRAVKARGKLPRAAWHMKLSSKCRALPSPRACSDLLLLLPPISSGDGSHHNGYVAVRR